MYKLSRGVCVLSLSICLMGPVYAADPPPYVKLDGVTDLGSTTAGGSTHADGAATLANDNKLKDHLNTTINQVNNNTAAIAGMKVDVESAKNHAEAAAQSASAAQQSASAAQQSASDAMSSVSKVQESVSKVQDSVSGLQGTVSSMQSTVSGVVDKVGEAAANSTSALNTASNAEKIAKETRQDMNNYKNEVDGKVNDFKNEVDNKVTDFKNEVNAKNDAFKSDVNNTVSSFKNDVETRVSTFENTVNTEMKEYQSAINTTVGTIHNEVGEVKASIQGAINDSASALVRAGNAESIATDANLTAKRVENGLAQEIVDRKNDVNRGIATANAYTDSKFKEFTNQIEKTKKFAAAGTASALAASQIPQVSQGSAFSLGLGMGNYSGESALSIGLSARLGDYTVTKLAFTSDTANNVGAGMGIAVEW